MKTIQLNSLLAIIIAIVILAAGFFIGRWYTPHTGSDDPCFGIPQGQCRE